MLMSVTIGLVWFKMFLSIYYDVGVCRLSVLVWSGLRWILSIYYDVYVCQYWSGLQWFSSLYHHDDICQASLVWFKMFFVYIL